MLADVETAGVVVGHRIVIDAMTAPDILISFWRTGLESLTMAKLDIHKLSSNAEINKQMFPNQIVALIYQKMIEVI